MLNEGSTVHAEAVRTEERGPLLRLVGCRCPAPPLSCLIACIAIDKQV